MAEDGKAYIGLNYDLARSTGGLVLHVLEPWCHMISNPKYREILMAGGGRWEYGDKGRLNSMYAPIQSVTRQDPKEAEVVDFKTLGMVFKQNAERLLVVTGAGLSQAAGVWTLDDLYKALSVQTIDSLTNAVFEAPQRLVNRFGLFIRQLYVKKPTQAHLALTAMQRLLGFTIITCNRDDLHEKAGLIPVQYDAIDTLKMDKYSALLIIGMSRDHLNLIPSFIRSKKGVYCQGLDACVGAGYWLPGDCQIILPNMADYLAKHGG